MLETGTLFLKWYYFCMTLSLIRNIEFTFCVIIYQVGICPYFCIIIHQSGILHYMLRDVDHTFIQVHVVYTLKRQPVIHF